MINLWMFGLIFLPFQEKPRLISEHTLYCVLPDSLLGDSFVQEQLNSGLTTTFFITCENRSARKNKASVAFRVDIRFEPWDEIYIVDVWQKVGGYQRSQIAGLEALREWWKTPRLVLAQSNQPGTERGSLWSIRLEMLPFSQSETQRAREWLAASRSSVREAGRRESVVTNNPAGRVVRSDVIGTILATSIQREVLFRKRWQMRVPH